SSAWVGQSLGVERAARGELRTVAAAQVVAHEAQEVRSAEAVVGSDRQRQRTVPAGDLLHHAGDGERVERGSAQLLGNRHPQEPELADVLYDSLRETFLAVPLLGVRLHLPHAEVADRRHQLALALVQLEVQNGSPSVPFRANTRQTCARLLAEHSHLRTTISPAASGTALSPSPACR